MAHPREQALAGAWLRAAVATSLATAGVPSLTDAAVDDLVANGLHDEAIAPLLSGRLVVVLRPGAIPRWDVSWEFANGEKKYSYVIAGGGMVDTLGPAGSHPSAAGLIDRFARDDSLADLDCSFERLLAAGGACQLHLTTGQGRQLKALEELAGLTSFDVSGNRTYGFGCVIACVLHRRLVLSNGQRLPPKADYKVADLSDRPDLADGQAVPLELFRLKNGIHSERALYDKCQMAFTALTDRQFEVAAKFDSDGTEVTIEPEILDGGRGVPLRWAGAGLWEALVISVLLTGDNDRVVVLDEPAVNLHPTLQRRLTGLLAKCDAQTVVITHSPSLVTGAQSANLGRVRRLCLEAGVTVVHRLPPRCAHRGYQRFMDLPDVRSCLFSSGVLLVEGDTEFAALDIWLADLGSTSPLAMNVALLPIGSDSGFGAYAEFLTGFGIPWQICCDGPVLDPGRKNNLASQLGLDPVPAALTGTALRAWWAEKGVHTLSPDGPDGRPSGEIESFFMDVDGSAWKEARMAGGRNKPLRGREFARRVGRPSGVELMWADAVRRFRAAPGPA